MESKTCEECQTEFHQSHQQKIRPKRWERTRFCSVPCGNRWRAKQRRTRPYMIVCEQCETSFESPDKRRRFCGRDCASAFNRTTATRSESPPKTCEQCEQQFTRREDERSSDYNTRRFCDRVCSAKWANSKRDYAVKKPKSTFVRTPPVIDVPPPPPSKKPQVVWRPASWGGPITVS